MNIRIVTICLYIALIYWLSLHYPVLHTLFFPTLGSFSFLFIMKTFDIRVVSKITLGAIISSIIGTGLFSIHPGVVSLLITTLITIGMINKFKWNAPPILAVSFIPFFSNPPQLWAIPLSVAASLIGLTFILFVITLIENKIALPAFLNVKSKMSVKSD
jgi:hypothetical protein